MRTRSLKKRTVIAKYKPLSKRETSKLLKKSGNKK